MPDWKPQKKLSCFIKWGYKIDPHDPERIIPIPEMEALMDQALKYLRTGKHSFRDVADWLSANSGTRISHVALRNHFTKVNRKKWREYAARYTAAAREKDKANRIRTIADSGNAEAEGQGSSQEGGSVQ